MINSIKTERKADTLTVTNKDFQIVLTFKDSNAFTFFVDLYTETNIELYPLICDFITNELITEQQGAEFINCLYLDLSCPVFSNQLEEVDK